MEKVDVLVVDKTGTLTEGKPAVTSIAVAAGQTEGELLRLAASLERSSEHPLAAAMVAAAEAKGLDLQSSSDFQSFTGRGVTGRLGGATVVAGNRSLMQAHNIDFAELDSAAVEHQQQGETVVYVAVDGVAAGLLGVADPVKATTPAALDALRKDGLRIVMLTGDSEATAQAVAKRLGIADVSAEVLPEEKGAAVQQLQRQGHRVAMAGDGINDAPALALADVGIAMGSGADVAMESAGITLVQGDLGGIAKARRLSRGTMRNIRQNLGWAFGYNALGVPVAAGLLYPLFGLLLSPMIAAAAMSFSSLSVIANALRLRSLSL